MISTPTANSCQRTSRPGEREARAEHADDQRADQRADDRAAAAEQTGAADHHGGDAVEIGVLAARRADGADAADQHPAGDRGDQPGEDIDREQDAIGVDAGEVRRLRIIADRVDVAAEGGAVEHVPDDRCQHDEQERAVGELGAADLDGIPINCRNGAFVSRSCERIVSLCEYQSVQRVKMLTGAERDDEGRQLQPRHQGAVEIAAQRGRTAGRPGRR